MKTHFDNFDYITYQLKYVLAHREKQRGSTSRYGMMIEKWEYTAIQ